LGFGFAVATGGATGDGATGAAGSGAAAPPGELSLPPPLVAIKMTTIPTPASRMPIIAGTIQGVRLRGGLRLGAVASAAACLAGFFGDADTGSLTGVQLSLVGSAAFDLAAVFFGAVFVAERDFVPFAERALAPFGEDARALLVLFALADRAFFVALAALERLFAPFDLALEAPDLERVEVLRWAAIALPIIH
jgi:hypothetical protein